jgi:hypothetical protein
VHVIIVVQKDVQDLPTVTVLNALITRLSRTATVNAMKTGPVRTALSTRAYATTGAWSVPDLRTMIASTALRMLGELVGGVRACQDGKPNLLLRTVSRRLSSVM